MGGDFGLLAKLKKSVESGFDLCTFAEIINKLCCLFQTFLYNLGNAFYLTR